MFYSSEKNYHATINHTLTIFVGSGKITWQLTMTSFKGLAPLRFCNTKCNNPVAMKKEESYRKPYQDFKPKINYLPARYVHVG